MLPGDSELYKLSKRQLVIFGVMGLTGLAGTAVALAVATFVISAWMGLPLPVFGLNDGPEQPIAFPHTVHVETVGLDCTFCHRNVTKGEAATIPAVGLCMTCHMAVGSGIAGVEQLRDAQATGRAIDWIRVHRLPDHVQFVHEAHVRAFSGSKVVVGDRELADRATQIRLTEATLIRPGVSVGSTIDVVESATCSICHGDVGSMTKVSQVRPLKMGDCVNCHRDNDAPTDCTTCHY